MGGAFLTLCDWIEVHPKSVGLIVAFLAFVIPQLREGIGDGVEHVMDVIDGAIQEFEESRDLS